MDQSRKMVLIVEDEPSLAQALSDALSRGGFGCLSAGDGEAGLRTALEHRPDLIMLDLLMPKMDGIEMLKMLRRDEWGKDAKVLILTNLSADTTERVQQIAQTAPDFYLVKSDWAIGDIVKKAEEILT